VLILLDERGKALDSEGFAAAIGRYRDGGKRDLPYDEGLPTPQGVADDLGAALRPLLGATVSAMNDQHTFLRPADDGVRIGDVVRLGLSHPCTAFDKWHYLPVVVSQHDDRVVELVRTFF
ncbi:MAG: hypothetical protein J7484_12895, partial [Microbacterium sp.]|nr:hypothetical protein [Microbacterium sp.]